MNGNKYVVKNYKVKSRENLIISFTQSGNKISKTRYIGSELTGESVKWLIMVRKNIKLIS